MRPVGKHRTQAVHRPVVAEPAEASDPLLDRRKPKAELAFYACAPQAQIPAARCPQPGGLQRGVQRRRLQRCRSERAALQLAQRAKEVAPDDPSISDTLGWILYKRGIYQRALGLLKESAEADILVFNKRRGALAGAIVSAETYEHVSRIKAYLDALRISDKTRGRRLRVSDLMRKSRSELETRGR